MVIQKMTEMKENSSTTPSTLRRANNHPEANSSSTTKLRGTLSHRMSRNMAVLIQNKQNTKAEFKRLKTILPSIRRKDNVSKLDIILEAIKYIDDLQDQLIDRLSGPRSEREATLLALTSSDDSHVEAIEGEDRLQCFDAGDVFEMEDEDEEDDLISLSDGYMSDPGLISFFQASDADDAGSGLEDEDDACSSGGGSHASLEL